MLKREDIHSAVNFYGNAEFECGKWDDDCEESYEDVFNRAQDARRELNNTLGQLLPAPAAAPDVLISAAVEHLRHARELLKQAGAPRAADKVRAALSSAQGARRHALNADARAARQAVQS